MLKKPTADRVIPALVDAGFIILLIIGFNWLAVQVLAYANDLRGVESSGVGNWEMLPISVGAFIGARFLQVAGQTLDKPTRLSRTKKEEANDE